MKKLVAAFHRLIDGRAVVQIAGIPLDIQAFKIGSFGTFPHETTHLNAFFDETAHDVAPDKPGAACDQG